MSRHKSCPGEELEKKETKQTHRRVLLWFFFVGRGTSCPKALQIFRHGALRWQIDLSFGLAFDLAMPETRSRAHARYPKRTPAAWEARTEFLAAQFLALTNFDPRPCARLRALNKPLRNSMGVRAPLLAQGNVLGTESD